MRKEEVKGKIVIVAGPSGSGKTTLCRLLMQRISSLVFSISATTRQPRGTEQEGVEYYFLEPDEFRRHIDAGDFLEYEEVYAGRYYGTLNSEINRIWTIGKTPLLDLDVLGARNIKNQMGDDILIVFIHPGDEQVLEARLSARGTESAENIKIRLERAKEEISHAHAFDHVISNTALEDAAEELYKLVSNFLGTAHV